jgi:general nucleoside transport system ATP-binding protein
MNTPTYALEAVNISKQFAGVVALDKVSLRLRTGSFHALLGENGAGKSTLVKCIMGYYHPEAGQIMVGDREHDIASPHAAHALGIGMVYQHFTLIPNMTVAENIVLARPKLPAVIDWRSEMRALKEKMQRMPFQIPLEAPINGLAAGEKQKVEIIKQLMLDPRVLILDEPTSVLTPNEADEVLGQVQRMTREQGLSVLIITHKFREVTGFADEVTVLRKGKYAGTALVSEATPQSMAAMMVGSEVLSQPLQRTVQNECLPVLEIRDLRVDDDHGVAAVDGLSLDVGAGEIVGIAGVSGNGQRELVQALSGQRQPHGGEIRVHGEAYTAQRAQMRKHRFHCLPEEPLRNACVGMMSVAENLALRHFDQPPYAKSSLLNRGAMRATARQLIERFGIRTPSADQPVGTLSGGNVQRTVLARELSDEVQVLVVANPCFGLDFGAVADIHAQIMAARNRGAAVLLVSEDLDEILEMSDRLFVISGGSLLYQTTPAKADLTTIGQYMAGH